MQTSFKHDVAAASLRKHKGGGWLSLNGLRSLTDIAAKSLAKYSGDCLSLEELDDLSDDAAQALSTIEGRMILSLNHLPKSAAEILRDALEPTPLVQEEEVLDTSVLTAELADKFAAGSYYSASLHEFTSIEDDAAKILGKTDVWLNLDGLTELSDAAAKGLSKHKMSSFASSGTDSAARFLPAAAGP